MLGRHTVLLSAATPRSTQSSDLQPDNEDPQFPVQCSGDLAIPIQIAKAVSSEALEALKEISESTCPNDGFLDQTRCMLSEGNLLTCTGRACSASPSSPGCSLAPAAKPPPRPWHRQRRCGRALAVLEHGQRHLRLCVHSSLHHKVYKLQSFCRSCNTLKEVAGTLQKCFPTVIFTGNIFSGR